VALLLFYYCNILPFITPNSAFNFCGERIFVFPVKRQHKERGGKKRGWTAEVDDRGAKKRKKKNVWAQREKKRKEKEREWIRRSLGLILALGFFSSSLFFRSKTLDF